MSLILANRWVFTLSKLISLWYCEARYSRPTHWTYKGTIKKNVCILCDYVWIYV